MSTNKSENQRRSNKKVANEKENLDMEITVNNLDKEVIAAILLLSFLCYFYAIDFIKALISFVFFNYIYEMKKEWNGFNNELNN